MRTADIKVGETYAYGRSKYSSAQEVTVLETGVTEIVGWDTKRNTGVRVHWANRTDRDGNELVTVVSSREIIHTWAVETERREAAAKRAQERSDALAVERADRAAFLKRLDVALSAHGVAPKVHHFYNVLDRQALRAAGNEFVGDDVVTRVSDPTKFFRTGELQQRDVAYLLADVEASWYQ